ncbi:MAG TPA: NAD(P)H-dependent oxidoreductase subunit E [Vicinamibacterales bacterium]|nr:NAD(P)H-dependent oxidoreductase subunit E [Vicinamibacterales bacterium]
MDIHLIPGAVATPVERDAIDGAIAPSTQHPAPSTKHQAPGNRHLLLPALHAVQRRVGWISEGALNHICERLSIAPADAYGVASFYAMFSLSPRPPLVVHVCDDIACRANGAEALCRELEQRLGKPGEPADRGAGAPGLDVGGRATWVRSPCLGQCDRAPAAFFQVAGEGAEDATLTNATVNAIVAGAADSTTTVGATAVYADEPRLLRRVCLANPESVVDYRDYRAHGGYDALERALVIGADAVIREVTEARLVGRGGALFPTGRKWDAVARHSSRPHYLVCNADESEPGTFKDRVLMEADPFAVIEAMTIAGCATGCEQGFLYIRGEYPLATARLRGAIEAARARGLLGDDILGAGVRFDVELRRGAGAYICGEETALFNSIEGRRGEPRNKPPFPVDVGLFGQPTVVNNVETLVNVLPIVLDGGAAYARIGTGQSTGTRLFCLSGSVTRPGVYEVPQGVTLAGLIAQAGGVRDGRALQAVLLGGAAGVFVTPQELDMPLTVEGARAAGATLGSGVVMLFDDRVDLGDITRRIAAFFRDESCGQCVPCRIGTIRQEELLHRRQLPLIEEVAQVMRDASICGLGQTASSAVLSAIKKLRIFDVETAR